MRTWLVVGLLGLVTQPANGLAQVVGPPQVSAKRQLSGVSPEAAATLLRKLRDAQQRLSRGEFQGFELLAGANASSDKIKTSALQAFLSVPFDQVWSIARVRSDNRLKQPYRLAYAPDGLGQPYWDIVVDLSTTGSLERVMMFWRPPAPF